MTLTQLITHFGYPLILAGTFLEGETILLLSGFLAHRGFLELHWVMVSAFAGSLAGDQFFFMLGRRHGNRLLEKRPDWHRHAVRIQDMLHRHRYWLIISMRFMYGLRVITPILIGTSPIRGLQFLWLNAIGALLWAVSGSLTGYLLSEAIEKLLGRVHDVELLLAVVVTVLAVTGFALARWNARRSSRDEDA